MQRTEFAHPIARALKTIAIVVFLLPAIAAADAAATSGHAAVAAPDAFGARAAMDVMKRGGNAVDAAVATAFVLAVTYPEAGNLGGGGFMMIYEHGKGSFLDYRETAPAAATRNMYLDDPTRTRSTTGSVTASSSLARVSC